MTRPVSRREFLKLSLAAGLFPLSSLKLRQHSSPAQDRSWQVSGPEVPELSSYDTALRSFMQARGISGAALTVTQNGRLLLARGYTWSDDPQDLLVQPTSLFRIASVSKPVTAAAVLHLCQAGRLALDTRLLDLLTVSPLPGETLDPRWQTVTVRRLLQHLGGWDWDLAYDPMFRDPTIAAHLGRSLPIGQQDILTYMAGQPLQHEPGQVYSYSNFGYCLLGKVIEAASGLPYAQYVRNRLFAPLLHGANLGPSLGCTAYSDRRPDEVKYHSQWNGYSVFEDARPLVSAPYGAWNLENMQAHGGWLASAVDLARFAASFDDPQTCPILSADSISTMFALPENIALPDYQPGDAYYACGWQVRDWLDGYRNTWHSGGLDGTFTLLVRRGDGLGWCVLFNQRDDPSGLDYMDIDLLLHQAAAAVANWPDHDLFPTYLPHQNFFPALKMQRSAGSVKSVGAGDDPGAC